MTKTAVAIVAAVFGPKETAMTKTETKATEAIGVEAYGVKGLKSARWRRTFKTTEALMEWAEANDADILGTRDVAIAGGVR